MNCTAFWDLGKQCSELKKEGGRDQNAYKLESALDGYFDRIPGLTLFLTLITQPTYRHTSLNNSHISYGSFTGMIIMYWLNISFEVLEAPRMARFVCGCLLLLFMLFLIRIGATPDEELGSCSMLSMFLARCMHLEHLRTDQATFRQLNVCDVCMQSQSVHMSHHGNFIISAIR